MLNTAIEIAKDAGSIIRNAFREQISIEYKTNESNYIQSCINLGPKNAARFELKFYATLGFSQDR